MSAIILRGDARELPLPDASVDLIVTSPPYYGLRSYTDGGEHYLGQIGSEATPAKYVAALTDCTREWVRVLKPSGSMWVNLGDKYASGGRGTYDRNDKGINGRAGDGERGAAVRPRDGFPEKSLLGLPWRYALACIDQLGLILRAEIIWSKPNGLPESVQDRVRRSHEQVFHFTRLPRYYSAVDEIREPHQDTSQHAMTRGERTTTYRTAHLGAHTLTATNNPLGKLPGSVWTIPSQPLTVPAHLGVDHFAAFPMELPRRIIAGWSPPGVCTACGEGRRPVVSQDRLTFYGNGRHRSGAQQVKDGAAVVGWAHDEKWRTQTTITGYACACTDLSGASVSAGADTHAVRNSAAQIPGRPGEPAPTRPAVVLDPFGGTGTTALIAHALGRTGITIDRSADYSRLARWRTTDPGQRAAAMQVDKPPAQVDGQLDLFVELTG